MAALLLRRYNALSPLTRGMFLGLLAMVLFGLTLPMTRVAIGDQAAPQLSPLFVTFSRAVLAAAMSIGLLALTRSPLPKPGQWRPLAMAALGNVIGYPLLLAIALRSITASHAAVITALLPLATAAIAAWSFRQRPGIAFWSCAMAGAVLVMAYSLLRSNQDGLGFRLEWADILVVASVLAASFGYVQGAMITPQLGAERVICWVTVISLPVTIPGTLLFWPSGEASASAWLALVYLGLFSMWIGFFAWYRGLAIGGAVKVSQVQLLQPFFAILFSVPLLGEQLDALTVGCAAAVVMTVYIGKRISSGAQ